MTYVRFFTKKVNEICVLSPLKGEVISLDKVPDETFATKILGDGAAIIPSVGILYASDDGEVLSVADTKHAVAVRYKNGVEILVHIGIDTVELGGEGYDALVQAGDKIKKGDVLIKFDIDKIKKKGYSVITPVIITNSDEFAVVSCHEGNIDTFETLLKLKK